MCFISNYIKYKVFKLNYIFWKFPIFSNSLFNVEFFPPSDPAMIKNNTSFCYSSFFKKIWVASHSSCSLLTDSLLPACLFAAQNVGPFADMTYFMGPCNDVTLLGFSNSYWTQGLGAIFRYSNAILVLYLNDCFYLLLF